MEEVRPRQCPDSGQLLDKWAASSLLSAATTFKLALSFLFFEAEKWVGRVIKWPGVASYNLAADGVGALVEELS